MADYFEFWRYFQLKTLTSLVLGAAVGISLLALGVPGSGFFAIVTGLANFIPVFGGPIAALLPLVRASQHETISFMKISLMKISFMKITRSAHHSRS